MLEETTPFVCLNCDWTGTYVDVFDHAKENPGHIAAEVLDGPDDLEIRIEATRKQGP